MGWLLSTRIMGRNLLAPGRGLLGRLASKGMTKSNRQTSEDAAARLGVAPGHTVVELGPGSGWGLRVLAAAKPERLIGVEISPRFRAELTNLDLPVNPEIRGEDAIDMSAFVQAGSVDRLLAVNVVYFLDPLADYAAEMHRVMTAGGRALLACKFHLIQGTHDQVFVNKDKAAIVAVFEAAGFTVSAEDIDLGARAANYTALHLQK